MKETWSLQTCLDMLAALSHVINTYQITNIISFGCRTRFWPEGRVALWEEKLQLRAAFAGNEATDWGTQREAVALARYQQLTGHLVSACRFSVLRDDVVHGWLGASPDGLIDSLAVTPGKTLDCISVTLSLFDTDFL